MVDFAAAAARYSTTCPAPFFVVDAPDVVAIGAARFQRGGASWTKEGARHRGPGAKPLVLGVLGAVKDADDATRENLLVAAQAFAKQGVDAVVVNGDLTSNETSAIGPVVNLLAEVFPSTPVLAHAGNYEWTSGFSQAFADVGARAPQLINMNLVRDVDFGGVHVVSLPGYFNRHFAQSGSCHYRDEDVAAVGARAQELAARGDVVVLTSHGPPAGTGALALDVTYDGAHVGDPALTRLLRDAGIHVGLFSHILEAGGRAVVDVDGAAAAAPGKAAANLYVNVGSASAFGWELLPAGKEKKGKTSRGMAAIVVVDASGAAPAARVEWLTLRK